MRRKYRKPISKVMEELSHQLAALRSSSKSFDEGNTWEAKRLAVSVYNLIHDSGRQTISLWTQLQFSRANFLSSARELNPKNILAEMPLVVVRFNSNEIKYVSLITAEFPIESLWRPFNRWWDQGILRDQRRREISRKGLVFSLRNQDGGAHSDPALEDAAYVSFSRERGDGWTAFTAERREIVPSVGPHLASMRQIAWEVEQSVTAELKRGPSSLSKL